MSRSRVPVTVTTDASGNATVYSPAVAGELTQVAVTIGTLTVGAVDFTITEEDTGAALLSLSNLAASARYPVRVPVTDTSGSAIASTYDEPSVSGRIKIVVAQGGNVKTGTVTFHIEGASALDATALRTLTPSATFLSDTVQQGLAGGRANT